MRNIDKIVRDWLIRNGRNEGYQDEVYITAEELKSILVEATSSAQSSRLKTEHSLTIGDLRSERESLELWIRKELEDFEARFGVTIEDVWFTALETTKIGGPKERRITKFTIEVLV